MTTGTTTGTDIPTRMARLSDLALSVSMKGPDKTTISFSNPRVHSGLGVAEIKELAEDLEERGQLTPFLVRPVIVEGKTILVVTDGQRRYRAREHLKKNGKLANDEVPVRETHAPEEFTPEIAAAMLDDALAVGSKREALSSYELVHAAVQLRAADKTNEQIGKTIGRSGSWVSRFLAAYTSAAPEVVTKWRSGQITDEQFKDVAKTPKAQQTELLTQVIELRETGDRSAVAEARHTAKLAAPAPALREAKSSNGANGTKGDIKATTVPPVKAKGDAKATTAAPPKPAKPSPARLAEFVELRRQQPSREPYIRGLHDMAAFAMGEIGEDSFAPIYRAYVKALERTASKPKAGAAVKAATAGDKPKGAEAKAKPPKKKHGDKAKAVAKGKPKKRGK